MVVEMTKSALSPERAHLVKLMQNLNHGWINDLVIHGHEPVFDPPIRVVRQVKFGADNNPRPEVEINDFVLKGKVCDLFAHVDELDDGTAISIEVKHGLPFMMQVVEVIA